MVFRESRTMKRSFAGFVALGWLLWLGWPQPLLAGSAPTLKIEVDARDLPRRLVHSRIQVPCPAGKAQALVSQVGARHTWALWAGAERGRPASSSAWR